MPGVVLLPFSCYCPDSPTAEAFFVASSKSPVLSRGEVSGGAELVLVLLYTEEGKWI